jgi:glycosyltransferase involved in cell wall biosynthesis
VVTVPTGLDLDALRPGRDPAAVQRGLGLPPEAILIGQVANLRPMKGHREVIEAIPAVVDRHPEAYFVFVGRDELGGALEVRARALGIESRVRFLGYCSDATSFIAAFDLVLLPSRWEGLPVSILEAMALGKPVLATAVGGIPELVSSGETGLLIPEAQPEQIAAAVNALLADRAALAHMGARAADRARRHFTRERMVADMESIYLRLLRRARRRIP